MKVLVTTVPFGVGNPSALDLLKNADINPILNPYNRKLTEHELAELVSDVDVIIAGTEPITEHVISRANRLKLISRVGIGLDSVDLIAAHKYGINVSYTPDAPTAAVAELTVIQIMSLLRGVGISNIQLRNKFWQRHLGRSVANVTVGIVGLGRVGKQVIKILNKLEVKEFLVNDIQSIEMDFEYPISRVSKEEIYKEADVISIHVPLTIQTKNMIRREHLLQMKSNAVVINTSRGGVINEEDLYEILQSNHLLGVALDVFQEEPYMGKLIEADRCLLTAHMGSMTYECRARMEIEATKEVLRFIEGKPLLSMVPEFEFKLQKESLSL